MSFSQASALVRTVPALRKAGLLRNRTTPRDILNIARFRLTLARALEQAYVDCPDRLALIDDSGTLTYRQLRDQARTLARFNLSHGLGELRVGVMARNGRGAILPLAAKGYTGGEIHLLNINSSTEQVAGCVKTSRINLLFADDEFKDRLPTGPDAPVVVTSSELEKLVLHPERYEGISLPRFPRHGHIVLFSSGTTGIPKGVVRPEPIMPTAVVGLFRVMPLRSGMRIQMTTSIFHTWGWALTQLMMSAHCTIITSRVFNPRETLEQIQRYRIQGSASSPIFFKKMLHLEDHESYDTSSLEFIASSGNSLSPYLTSRMFERFGPILCNIYGSTELSFAAAASAEELAADPTVAGLPSHGTTVKILDNKGNELPTGSIGRIFVRNSTSLSGYTDPTIPVVKEAELIEIGDTGYLDEAGMLHVVGRIDDMIIVGGENVHPRSVEEVLEPMPGIQDVAAAGVDDDEQFKRVSVWIVPEPGVELDPEDVRQWVRDNLADHSVPRDVHFIDELPRTATGKVIPRLLPGI